MDMQNQNKKILGGYYIKARCIQESWIATAAPVVRETWDYLLREANHKDQKYMGFLVKRGQLFRSYHDIRDGLKWRVGYRFETYSESSMKRAMKLLREEGMIELTSEPRGNLITIVNYDRYQQSKNYERTSERTDERTSSEPVANHQRPAINKNVKKEKNVKNKHSVASAPAKTPKETTPIQEIVNYFFELMGWDYKDKTLGVKYARYVRDAKDVLYLAGGDVSRAKKEIARIHRWAEQNELEWALGTVVKKWGDVLSEKKVKPYYNNQLMFKGHDGNWHVHMLDGSIKKFNDSESKIVWK